MCCENPRVCDECKKCGPGGTGPAICRTRPCKGENTTAPVTPVQKKNIMCKVYKNLDSVPTEVRFGLLPGACSTLDIVDESNKVLEDGKAKKKKRILEYVTFTM